jgi:hypothetical protein
MRIRARGRITTRTISRSVLVKCKELTEIPFRLRFPRPAPAVVSATNAEISWPKLRQFSAMPLAHRSGSDATIDPAGLQYAIPVQHLAFKATALRMIASHGMVNKTPTGQDDHLTGQ